MNYNYLLIPANEMSDGMHRLSVFMTTLSHFGSHVGNCNYMLYPIAMPAYINSYEELKNLQSTLPADTFACVKEEYDDENRKSVFDVDGSKRISEENINEFMRLMICPQMNDSEELHKMFEVIYAKFGGIYDAAERLIKKCGIGPNIEHGRMIDVGVASVINDTMNKFCKEHRDVTKVKYDIGLVLDADVAPAFKICSYLKDKGARIIMYPDKNNVFRFAYPLDDKSINSGIFWNGHVDANYAMAIVAACIQEGIGMVNTNDTDFDANDRVIVGSSYNKFMVTEDEVEAVIKVARKVHNGSFKYIMHYMNNGSYFHITEDGSIAVDITIFQQEKRLTENNDEEENSEEAK